MSSILAIIVGSASVSSEGSTSNADVEFVALVLSRAVSMGLASQDFLGGGSTWNTEVEFIAVVISITLRVGLAFTIGSLGGNSG